MGNKLNVDITETGLCEYLEAVGFKMNEQEMEIIRTKFAKHGWKNMENQKRIKGLRVTEASGFYHHLTGKTIRYYATYNLILPSKKVYKWVFLADEADPLNTIALPQYT